MRKPRRNHSATLRARVTLEAIRVENTVAEIAAHHEVHATQETDWKTEMLQNAAMIEAAGTKLVIAHRSLRAAKGIGILIKRRSSRSDRWQMRDRATLCRAQSPEIAFHNTAVSYAALFDVVAATLKTVAANPPARPVCIDLRNPQWHNIA